MDPVQAARELSREVSRLRFSAPVSSVYDPLDYAWKVHELYLKRYGAGPREVLLVGMNPGPWGMAQTGVPFGQVASVRDWMGLEAPVGKPEPEHPKRLVQGFSCRRSEVSGARLWGWAAQRFGKADDFFRRFFVLNYCPLLFIGESGANLTPDKLRAAEREPLTAVCDLALRRFAAYYRPRLVIGVGQFAEARARLALSGTGCAFGAILHPSPASPAANRGWSPQAEAQLKSLGVRLP